MCRECKVEDVVQVEWLDPEEDLSCEWIDEEEAEDLDESGVEEDEEVPMCCEEASLLLHMRMVQAHLCAAHTMEEKAELASGFGDLLEDSGLQTGSEFVALGSDERESCDECSNPATHAHVVLYEQFYCETHAREAGASLPARS